MAEPTPCQTIDLLDVSVLVKREDLNHPVVQGNKLWKLKHNLLAAKKQQSDTVVTFGGAFSNHLLATAYAAKAAGLAAVGIVRGDELDDNQAVWSETLHRCAHYGMRLEFVNRKHYRQKQHSQAVQRILSELPHAYLIPEGGSNLLATQGVADMVAELAQQLRQQPTHLICPVGTGGTLAGLITGVSQQGWHSQVTGVSVLRGLNFIEADVQGWTEHLAPPVSWRIVHDFHGGGYAKRTPEMTRFAVTFSQQHGIPLDKVYNIKSFYALAHMIKSGQLTTQDHPLIIHTGGLQGGVL